MRRFVIREFVDVAKLTPARRRKALERMKPAAVERKMTELAAAIERAMAKEDRALALAVLWAQTAADHAIHEDGAQKLDAQLDRAISGLYESIQLIVRAFDDQRAKLARALLDAFFPEGPGAITNLPYVEQNALVGSILARLGEAPHSDAIATLSLGDWVARIAELNKLYGELLTRPERLTHAEVLQADREGWSAMLSVIARVLGAHPDDTESDIAARRTLLQPITDQQDELAILRARRRGEGPAVRTSSDEALDDEALDDEALDDEPPAEEAPAP